MSLKNFSDDSPVGVKVRAEGEKMVASDFYQSKRPLIEAIPPEVIVYAKGKPRRSIFINKE